jgi:GTP cyclohydrolase I
MEKNFIITQAWLRELAEQCAYRINAWHVAKVGPGEVIRAYGVPRGGVSAALAIQQHSPFIMVDDPDTADIIIDDLVDSGKTFQEFATKYPGKPFFVLIDKKHGTTEFTTDKWVVFPWESNAEGSFEDNVVRLLQFVGEDPARGGLLETPSRVAKAWRYWCNGYGKDAAALLKVFEDGAERHDQMVTVKDIPIYSHCEHHLAPIFGTVTISYIPSGKIVGLSKLSRLADMYARRLQVQERLTDQIADALWDNLKPKGVGVMVKARHLCMESRGVCQQGHHTITTALRGVMLDQPEARSEFLRLAD